MKRFSLSTCRKLWKPIVILLLLNIAFVAHATPWDGVPDDPTPAQAIWMDPKNTTNLVTCENFTVDVLINVTDPVGAGTGLFGFQYKLQWNSTVLDVVEIQTHTDNIPSGDLLPGWTMVFVAANDTAPGYHSYAVSAIQGVAFTGVASLCTYTFHVIWQPEDPAPDFCGLLDIYDDFLVDDTATPMVHTTVDGMYCVLAKVKPLADFTWSPEQPKVGETVTFDGSLSTPNGGSILNYTWDFDDGTAIVTEADPITTHSYTAAGVYNVTLTVTDDEGLTGSATKSITVQENTPPTIGDPSRTPPGDIQPAQDVNVQVNVTDAESGVKNVTLSYTTDNGTSWTDIEMTYNATSSFYEATIPGQSAWTWVKFSITAYDNAENSATRDGTAAIFVYQVIPEFLPIIMLLLFMIMAVVAVVLRKRSSQGSEGDHSLPRRE